MSLLACVSSSILPRRLINSVQPRKSYVSPVTTRCTRPHHRLLSGCKDSLVSSARTRTRKRCALSSCPLKLICDLSILVFGSGFPISLFHPASSHATCLHSRAELTIIVHTVTHTSHVHHAHKNPYNRARAFKVSNKQRSLATARPPSNVPISAISPRQVDKAVKAKVPFGGTLACCVQRHCGATSKHIGR